MKLKMFTSPTTEPDEVEAPTPPEVSIHAEAITSGRLQLDPLMASAEGKLAEFIDAVETARKAEGALFVLLFDEQSGLKQHWPEDIRQDAHRARHSLRIRAEKAALANGHLLSDRFETDGEVNLGAQYRDHFETARLLGRR